MIESNYSSFIRPDKLWRDISLRANQTVVHLGCGAGYYLVPAAQIIGKKGKAIGVDVLPDMLAEAENRAELENVAGTVQTVRANLENDNGSSLGDNTADWVLVANILHQSDPAKILKEAKRIVKDDGKVVVIEWDIISTPFGPPPEKRLSREDTLSIAEAEGLVAQKKFNPSPYHYGFILKKNGGE